MSKRADFMAQAKAVRSMDIKKDNDSLTSVDNIVDEIDKSIHQDDIPVKPAKELKRSPIPDSVSIEEIKISPNLIKNLRPQEMKTAHLNLLVTESVKQKLTILAKQRGVSINALVNEILTNAFECV